MKAVIRVCLCVDSAKCTWIDCLGREAHLRQGAFQEVMSHVQSMDGSDVLDPHSQQLIELVL
jgi:hypothetical protein